MSVFLRKYATATTVYFPLIGAGTVNFTSTATVASTDIKISVDGGAFAITSVDAVNEGSFGYSYTCRAGTEMTGKTSVLLIHHTDGTQAFEDTMLIIETYGNSAAQHTFDLSIANQTVIASAGTVTLTGGQLVTVGTISAAAVGVGLLSAGAFAAGFLSAGGIAANAISAGGIATGAIDAYALATDAVTEIWGIAAVPSTTPPAWTASMLSTISWLMALSRNTITQTSVLQTVLQSDGATTLATSTVSDNGTTFTRGSFN